jgi:hypothetical protein
MMNVHKILDAKPEGKRLLGRPRHNCEDKIKMDLKKIKCKVVVWFHLSEKGSVVGSCENGNEL